MQATKKKRIATPSGRPLMSLGRWVVMCLFIALTGILYMVLFTDSDDLYMGPIYALACSLPLIFFESGRLLPSLHSRIQKFSTPGFFASTLLIYIVLTGIGFGAAGTVFKLLGLSDAAWHEMLILRLTSFIYTMAFFFVSITFLRIRQLLGREVFSSLFTGRYRKPLEEERIFLFVDIVGSTSYAREFGDLRAQEFLGEVFAGFAEHVRRHGGEIDDYVGDCAIITWRMKAGIEQAHCIACLYDILNDLESNRDWWLRQFGRFPQVCAALHGGSVVTAAIGLFHQKITYFGDTVNTTARIESLCKSLGKPHLISENLLERLVLPKNIRATPCGSHAIKGHDEPLSVFALERVTP